MNPISIAELELAVGGEVAPAEATDIAAPRADQFGLIPLKQVCPLLGLSPAVALKRFASGTLPVRAFRLSAGRRGPIFVHIDDLQRLINRRRQRAAGS